MVEGKGVELVDRVGIVFVDVAGKRGKGFSIERVREGFSHPYDPLRPDALI
jgi:hypothetical protein